MMRYAVVTEIGDKRIYVTYRGETIKSQMPLYYLASYVPSLNDVVVVDTNINCILGNVVLADTVTLDSRISALETINLEEGQ